MTHGGARGRNRTIISCGGVHAATEICALRFIRPNYNLRARGARIAVNNGGHADCNLSTDKCKRLSVTHVYTEENMSSVKLKWGRRVYELRFMALNISVTARAWYQRARGDRVLIMLFSSGTCDACLHVKCRRASVGEYI